ncbi:hypothetical protein [Nocardia mexicana]|uniref:HTH cro/C1-type domain-containing protein n=1 Tax=Nocardia mexicana TaxID=279262 RepID=A0A370GX36_9NOCA|nr:hypothetical protein [Nocardia mexicana]RDI48237.1 hypothetical protein DFR68_10866 [Nocardia mexicana]
MIVSTWTRIEVRALRDVALRMTQEEFAETLGFKVETIQKWEGRTTTIERPVRGRSAEALDTALAKLDGRQGERFRAAVNEARAGAATVVVSRRTEAAWRINLDSGGHDIERGAEDEVKRREFGILVGTALVAVGSDSAVGITRIGMDDARMLGERVVELAQRDQVIGGITLVQHALGQLEVAKRLLETCSFDDRAGRAFMTAAGELATLAGWLAHDADLNSVARRCYADAFALANQAGDENLTVHVCLNAAHQSIALSRNGNGNPHRALGLLSRARDLTRGQPPGRVHALIATREALAQSVLGERVEFGRAIATAWRELDFALEHESLDEAPGWLRFVNSNEVRSSEARAHGDLGDPARSAGMFATSAVEAMTPRNSACYRALWSTSLIKVGDVKEAVAQGLPVLAEVERKEISSTRVLRFLEPVRNALGDDPDNEFVNRFDTLQGRFDTLQGRATVGA